MRILFLILSLLFYSPAWGGFAEVGAGTQRAGISGLGATGDLAFPGNVVAGSLLIVAGIVYTDSGPVGVTDLIKTTYVVKSAAFGDERIFIAYGLAPSSGANTVTVTPNSASYMSFSIDEFSGADSAPLDVDNGANTGSDDTPIDSIVTLHDNALIVGVMYNSGGATDGIAEGSGYTLISEEENGGSYLRYSAQFKIATTAGAYDVDWAMDSSGSWDVYSVSFVPYVAVGGGSGRRRLNSQGIVIQ